jgi:predicted acyl esterase
MQVLCQTWINFGKDNEFWQQLKDHSSYDDFWQKRGILQHLKDIKPAVMTVGGWFDAEDYMV